MKILLLGGSRFIGPKLVDQLYSENDLVVFNRGNNKFNYPKNVKYVRGDRDIPQDLKQIENTLFDLIIDTCGYNELQIEKSANIIANTKKYIFISSAAVYKLGKKELLTETDELEPNTAFKQYGVGKVSAENKIKQIRNNAKLSTFILRPPYILGPNNPFNRENYFFDKLVKNEVIDIPCDDVRVSFADVDDVVKAVILFKNMAAVGINIFNIGDNKTYNFVDLTQLCAKVSGNKVKTNINKNVEGFPFQCLPLAVNSDKLNHLTKTLPTPLEKTLFKSWEFYTQNKKKNNA